MYNKMIELLKANGYLINKANGENMIELKHEEKSNSL